MFHNLAMLDGFALCGEDDDYERTYLDKIKIDTNYNQDQPIHIDKLFENEDAILDSSYESKLP